MTDLDAWALTSADIAFLDAQAKGSTTAECVRAAITAYLEAEHD